MSTEVSQKRLLIIFGMAAVIVLLAGAWLYHAQEQQVRQQAEAMLQATAQLKVDQISAWRGERLADADVLRESPFFLDGVIRYLATPRHDDADAILAKFRSLHDHYHYAAVGLIDAAGHIRLQLGAPPVDISSEVRQAITQARLERGCILTELYLAANKPQMDVIAPMFARGPQGDQYIGAVVLSIDPAQYLYPMLQSWPAPSRSAETLLVRREGNTALFLNDRRFQGAMALSRSIPLTQTETPAVMAVLGKTGVVQGKDYRGVAVVSVIEAIPHSSWFMVAKVDAIEVYSAWRLRAAFILALLLGVMALLGGVGRSFWQRNQFRHVLALQASEAARRASEERYAITLKSIGDAVIATDTQGRVTLLNPVAEALTGWTMDDALGRPLEEVFHIVNEGTRQVVENPVTRVLRDGVVVGLANHTVLIAQDGIERPIADSGAPIRDEQGDISGVVLVFRDVTAEYRAQRERENMVKLLRLLNMPNELTELLQQVIGFLQKLTGCEAVGVRLKDGDDFPYFETRGFPAQFVKKENALCTRDLADQLLRDEMGHPLLECMCGNVLCGRFDPAQPFFTAHGSFWSNSTTALLLTTTATERKAKTRNRCNGEGYESVALIPLRVGEDTLGLLQLNDHAKHRFTPELIAFLESSADQIAIALAQRQTQAALRQSEELYHSLFENMLNGFAYCRMLYQDDRPDDFTYLAVNPAFTTQTGLRDVVGKCASVAIPGIREADPELIATYGRVADSGTPESFEMYVAALKLWFAISVYSPKREHFVAVFDVISERKRNEAEMLRHNRLYAVLSQVNQAVVHASDALAMLEACCRAVVTAGGFKVGWIGRLEPVTRQVEVVASCGDAVEYVQGIVVSADDRAEGNGPVGVAIREGWPYVCDDFRTDPLTGPWRERALQYDLHGMAAFPIITQQGAWGVLAIYSGETGYFGDKETRLLEEAAADIAFALDHLSHAAQRRQILQSLRESEERFRTLFSYAPVGIVLTDAHGRFMEVNDVFCRILHFTRSELLACTAVDLTAQDEKHQTLLSLFNDIIGDSSGHFVEKRYLRGDGIDVWVKITTSSVRGDDGRFFYCIGVYEDITARKQMEAQYLQAQKMEVVGRLAGGIAHDFNNILTGVIGFSDMLLETTPPSSPAHADLSEIRRLGRRAADLTRQLLAFSRRQPLVMESVDLNELVENITRMLTRLLGEDITLCQVLASDLGPIKADAGQLEQVLLNLALNARDAMPQGGQLTLKTANVELGPRDSRQQVDVSPGAYILLAMTDTGIGMEPSVLEHIFEPFYTTKAIGKGSGLGLATVYGIIKQHGGSIEVESEPHTGTTFTMYLPRIAEPAGSRQNAALPCPTGSEAILLVDDEKTVRDVVERMLRGMGYTVYTAGNGAEAERFMLQDPSRVTLLLTDMVMPGMNGRELYERLAEVKADLKVLFMSGYTESAIEHYGVLMDDENLLQKPFSAEALARKIREVLDDGPTRRNDEDTPA